MNATTETTNAPPKTGRGIWKERPDSERGKWIKDRSERGLRKCASGNWAISFADQNGRVRSEVIGPSKAEARKVLEKRRTEVREKRYFPASAQRGGVTFDEVIEHAIKTARAEFEKKHPGKKFRPYRYKIVKTWFAGRKAHSVTPQEIQEKLNSHGGSLATWNHYRVTLSHAYKLAIMKGQADAQAQAPSPWTTITVNPAAQLQLQKPNNERVRFAEPEEEAALRAAILQLCPTREPEFDLALNTGMRWNEQYNLRRAQVDLKRSTITLLETKNGKRQYVRINAAARRALEQLLGSAPGSEFVCPDQDAWTHRRWWDAVREQAKVTDFEWHDLRHTFASRLVMAGVDLYTVSKLLRHKTLSVTQRYAHLSAAHLQQAVERLDGPSRSKCASKSAAEPAQVTIN